MTSSGFWKEREEEFRRHANEENCSFAADWDSLTDTWTFRGVSVERSERIFTSLARKAAQGINSAPGADACKAWLDSLRRAEYGFEVRFRHTGAYNQQRREYMARSGEALPVVEGIVDTVALPDGSIETRTLVEAFTGTIEHIFETSADFCLELGSHAPADAAEEARSDAKGAVAPDANGEGAAPANTPARTSEGSPTGAAKSKCQADKWEDIEISFLSDERVQITMGTHIETRNYDEMGFASKQNGTPVLAWKTLRVMAEAGGVIRVASDSGKWAKVEKRVQEIRKVLRHQFGLTDDPLPYTKKTQRNPEEFGYRTKFKLGCRPSYES
jgi:hypothetical protein